MLLSIIFLFLNILINIDINVIMNYIDLGNVMVSTGS